MAEHTVLYVANSTRIGGGIRVAIDLMANLDQRRFSCVLVAPGPGPLHDWARENKVPCELAADGDWTGAHGLARRTVDLVTIIQQHRVSIVHAVAPMAYRALGLAGRLTGALRVCHLGFPPEPGELKRSFVSGPDLVIACYHGQADEHRAQVRALHPGCRVAAVPNGVDVHRFSPGLPGPDVARLREGFETVVGILGHISDVKGHPTFVDAAALMAREMDRCAFWVIGGENAQPGARAAMEQSVVSLGLAERFRFLGFRSDVHEVLKAVDIIAAPSRSEGLPLALLEAMATGCAVVATPVGGVPETVVAGETGMLVPPDDPAALAAAIGRLVEDKILRRQLGAQARRSMEAHFSIGAFARGVENLYDDLLADRHGRPGGAGVGLATAESRTASGMPTTGRHAVEESRL